MNEVHLRTAATLPSADKFDDSNTPFLPTMPVKVAPFIREPTDVSPLTPYGLGLSNIRFEIPKTNGDNISKIFLNIDWAALATPAGGATYARYVDYLGIACVKELRIKYGTQTLQTIHKEHLWIYLNKFLNDEEQWRDERLIKGNMPTDQRSNYFKKAFRTKTPIYTAFFQDDLSKALHIQGMSQKLTVELDMEPDSALIQTDGVTNNIFQSNSASYMTAMNLHVEYNHVLMGERSVGIDKYRHPQGLRYLFHDIQECPSTVIPSSTSLNGADYTITLQNLSLPCNFLVVLFRWANDMTRTTSASGPSDTDGQGGRDWFNVSGWMAPLKTPVPDTSGPPTPIISQLAIKSGNNYVCKPTKVEDLVVDWGGRYFKGTPSLGIIAIPYSHVPTASNACMGSVDFGVIDQPQLVLTWNSSPNGYADIAAYAAADIGSNAASGLRVDVLAFCYNNVDVLNHDLYRPF